jgi:hypothetical protein
LPKEIAGPLIKFFNFGRKIIKIKSVCKYNSKFVPFMQKSEVFILAIESSCDDTAAAVFT